MDSCYHYMSLAFTNDQTCVCVIYKPAVFGMFPWINHVHLFSGQHT